MKKIFVLIALVLLLAACKTNGTSPINLPKINTGTKAIEAEWVKNSPPDKLFNGNDYVISFNLFNRGAADIVDGAYAVKVLDGDFLLLESPEGVASNFDLEGKKQTNPTGARTSITLQAHAETLPRQLDVKQEDIYLLLCYPYTTSADTDVCVDATAGTDTLAPKACSEAPVSLSGGQGGPISLQSVSVESIPMPNDIERTQPIVKLKVKNSGGKQFMLAYESNYLCRFPPRAPSTANQIELNAFLSTKKLRCPNPKFDKKGEAEVICKLEEGFEKTRGAFKTVLRVEMNYGYHEVLKKSVSVIKQ